jgi:hypothetical protein
MPLTQSTLVSPEPKTLPLTGASLRVDAGLGLAEVVLEQRFSNPHAEPLHVIGVDARVIRLPDCNLCRDYELFVR